MEIAPGYASLPARRIYHPRHSINVWDDKSCALEATRTQGFSAGARNMDRIRITQTIRACVIASLALCFAFQRTTDGTPAAGQTGPEAADLILHHGFIWTVDESKPQAEAIAARGFCISSRRRHARCGRDWSSDVCSSDLNAPF